MDEFAQLKFRVMALEEENRKFRSLLTSLLMKMEETPKEFKTAHNTSKSLKRSIIEFLQVFPG